MNWRETVCTCIQCYYAGELLSVSQWSLFNYLINKLNPNQIYTVKKCQPEININVDTDLKVLVIETYHKIVWLQLSISSEVHISKEISN